MDTHHDEDGSHGDAQSAQRAVRSRAVDEGARRGAIAPRDRHRRRGRSPRARQVPHRRQPDQAVRFARGCPALAAARRAHGRDPAQRARLQRGRDRNGAQARRDLRRAMTHRVLILGASYGSLFGTKLLMAGQSVTLVCTRPTAELINRDGTVVKFTIKGQAVDVPSKQLPGALSAATPDEVDPAAFDLVVLGMQEAQYGAPGVRELMRRIAGARVPCLAIMNMPPLPYLRRIPGIETAAVAASYADPGVWEGFDPQLVTLASPDPQAFRPPDQPKNVLQVGLPTNFKAARFSGDGPTKLLRELEAAIDDARFDPGDGPGNAPIEIPVKLKVHDSIFVPLAKWPMLITGNYRLSLIHISEPTRLLSISYAVFCL